MSESARYTVEWSAVAEKALMKLPKEVRKRLIDAAEQLAFNPRPRGSIKMEGKGSRYRIRSGTYRIIYEVQDNILKVLIIKVGDRKEVYRQ